MTQDIEQILTLRERMDAAVDAIDAVFPQLEGLLLPRKDEPGELDSFQNAAAVFNEAAQTELIKPAYIAAQHQRIAKRTGGPKTDVAALVRQFGRIAAGKPVISLLRNVNPNHYDPLTYGEAEKDKLSRAASMLAGVIISRPQLSFTVARATQPKRNALMMGVELTLATSEDTLETINILPAHIANLAVGQADIRRTIRALGEEVKRQPVNAALSQDERVRRTDRNARLEFYVRSVERMTPILRGLGSVTVRTDTETALINAENEERETYRKNRPPVLTSTNRRHHQNYLATLPRPKRLA